MPGSGTRERFVGASVLWTTWRRAPGRARDGDGGDAEIAFETATVGGEIPLRGRTSRLMEVVRWNAGSRPWFSCARRRYDRAANPDSEHRPAGASGTCPL